jgi:hypothetical protein
MSNIEMAGSLIGLGSSLLKLGGSTIAEIASNATNSGQALAA